MGRKCDLATALLPKGDTRATNAKEEYHELVLFSRVFSDSLISCFQRLPAAIGMANSRSVTVSTTLLWDRRLHVRPSEGLHGPERLALGFRGVAEGRDVCMVERETGLKESSSVRNFSAARRPRRVSTVF
jgi:hypothetical protein